MLKSAIVVFALLMPALASAQQRSTCLSPVFEKRLSSAVAKGEVRLKTIAPEKAQAYANCYARTACAKLTKIEFEMYALSAITSYDDKAEDEYLRRMRRNRKENDAALTKISPNELSATCKQEVGVN